MLFARDDVHSVKVIFDAFTKFSEASGLAANLSRSDVYLADIPTSDEDIIINSLGIPKGTFQFKYLGVPPTTRKLRYTDCKPLIEKTGAQIRS